MGVALRRRPVLNASVVRNSSVEENVGRSTIFIKLSVCILVRISSTSSGLELRSRRGAERRADLATEIGSSTSSGLTTLRRSTECHGRLLAIVVKNDRRRVDDPQATLELNGLQFLRVSRLRCNGTHLHGDGCQKGLDKHFRLKTNAMTHLGAFEAVDQTALTDIREADDTDGDILRRARSVRLE